MTSPRAGTPTEVTRALDAERKRISAELHDNAGANLAAVALNLRSIERRLGKGADAEVAELLADSQELLSEATAALREISSDMRPTDLDRDGLATALDERFKRFAHRTGLLIDWQCGDLGKTVRGASVDLLLFRTALEALTNCAKHANAKAVRVSLGREAGALVLRIDDDGRGFALEAPDYRPDRAAGMGLAIMRERVELAGGTMLVESRPGTGTRIEVRIPFDGVS
jgi:signal transduction histidine kinase